MNTKDQAVAQMGLFVIKGMMAELEPKDRDSINAAVAELRTVVEKYGDNGQIAFAIVNCEEALKP